PADDRAQLAEAREQAKQIIEEARNQAESMKNDIVSRAEQQAAEIVAQAREEAQAERTRALAEARRDVANLSIDLAERVVGQALDREAQLGLVERYITELESKEWTGSVVTPPAVSKSPGPRVSSSASRTSCTSSAARSRVRPGCARRSPTPSSRPTASGRSCPTSSRAAPRR